MVAVGQWVGGVVIVVLCGLAREKGMRLKSNVLISGERSDGEEPSNSMPCLEKEFGEKREVSTSE